MKNKLLEDYIVYVDDDIYYAHWKLYRNKKILVVLDKTEHFQGILNCKPRCSFVSRDATL